jgi:hypothetical protein
MRTVAALALAALVLAAPAAGAVAVVSPEEEASFPFFCDWGYDWEERCHWDIWSPRLSIGGDRDKVWRAGLRFPLDSVPAGAALLQAELHVYYDGVCVGIGGRSVPCDGRPWELQVVPILGAWFDDREPRLGFPIAWHWLPAGAPAGWMTWDVTDLVAEWLDEALENDGLLVKLADGQESFRGSGPRPPGRLFPDSLLRPRLEIAYVPPR